MSLLSHHIKSQVVQLEELLEVRHSVFVLGAAATGKSCVLRALFDVYRLQGQKPVWVDLNPKACTNHELYGYINMATREWVDGLFSSLMRDMSNIQNDYNKVCRQPPSSPAPNPASTAIIYNARVCDHL